MAESVISIVTDTGSWKMVCIYGSPTEEQISGYSYINITFIQLSVFLECSVLELEQSEREL